MWRWCGVWNPENQVYCETTTGLEMWSTKAGNVSERDMEDVEELKLNIP